MPEASEDDYKPRHTGYYKFVYKWGRKIVAPVVYKYYNVKTDDSQKLPEEPFLMFFNHTTDYDPVPVCKMMDKYSRFIVSADKKRKTINRVFYASISDFIFRVKGTKADEIYKFVEATLKEGINVTMAPEGQESPFGVTDEIRPKTGEWVKKLGCPIVTYRIEGGYFLKSPWAENRSDMPVFGKVINIYSKEQLNNKTPEEINKLIYDDLYINHYDWQREKMIPMNMKNRAESMEVILFICPECGRMNRIRSHEDDVVCDGCGSRATVDEYGFFKNFRFRDLNEWHQWQLEELKNRKDEWLRNPEETIFCDTDLNLKITADDGTVTRYEGTKLSMNAKGVTITTEEELFFPFEEIYSIASSTKWGVVVKTKDARYRFRGTRPYCTYKYRYAMKLIRNS